MRIARSEGVHAVSLKRIARDIGISEAQIYNYYKSLAEVLVAIARTELMEMNQGAPFRRAQLHRPPRCAIR